MKTLRVVLAEAAEADMAEIEWWIADQACDSRPAERYGGRLRERCPRIGRAPLIGVERPELGAGVRMAVFERSATVLYRVEADHVLILRILRAGRDVEAAARS